MFRYLLILLITLHGLIHFMGFAKAFQYAELNNLTIPISKPLGILWMLSAFLFLAVAILFSLKSKRWWIVAIPAVLISQVVIIEAWSDAKLGTIANIIILAAMFFKWGSASSERHYVREREERKTDRAVLVNKE